MAQLELVVMAGKESKQWLADVTEIVERLEKATAKLKGSSVTEDVETETTTDDDDDDDFTPTKSKATVKAKSFDDDDTGEDEEPVIKKKAKKITVDDVNDACKARAAETGGKEGRQEVLTILKKKFKVASVNDLEPEQYAAVIAAMKA